MFDRRTEGERKEASRRTVGLFTHLGVLDPVFEGLLQEVEGILLAVGLDHHVPGLLHLDLHHTHTQTGRGLNHIFKRRVEASAAPSCTLAPPSL